jgi:AcrR family transcriptional regulator
VNETEPTKPSRLADIRAGRRPVSQRALQKAETRRRLVDAARDAFIADGYARTTVDSIAARASTSRATFYLHFEGKLQVLEELIADLAPGAAQYYDRLDAILEHETRADFRAWVRDAMGWYELHGRLMPVWNEAHLTDPLASEALRHRRDEMLGHLAHYFDRARPAGEVVAARIRVEFLIHHLEHLFRAWAIERIWEHELDTAIDVLVDLWWPVLTASATPAHEP